MANVNEGERWTLCRRIDWQPSYINPWVVPAGVEPPESDEQLEVIEVVPAKALREAREELERLRELCRENDLDYGATPKDSSFERTPPLDGCEAGLADYLREDAPYLQCDACQRKTWNSFARDGDACGMPQPSGAVCIGRFRRALASEPKLDGSGR